MPAPTPPPGSPLWPCRMEAVPSLPPRLVAAWYVLLRDHVQPGDAEQMLLNAASQSDDYTFTNAFLEGLARAHVTYLMQNYYVGDEPRSVWRESESYENGEIVRLPNGQWATILTEEPPPGPIRTLEQSERIEPGSEKGEG